MVALAVEMEKAGSSPQHSLRDVHSLDRDYLLIIEYLVHN